jgi:hypothetical protein
MLQHLVTNLKLLLQVDGLLSSEDVTTGSADVQRVARGSYSGTAMHQERRCGARAVRVDSVEGPPGHWQP